MASNVQQGTRGLSAGDITRLKRLQGARTYQSDKPGDITNPAPRTEVETGRRVYTEFGTSKIRRPASNWTDYVASQTADFVIEGPSGECGVGKALTAYKICTCFYGASAIKHTGLCRSCTHDRIVNKKSNGITLDILN
jgi:hypothetical protein